MSVPTSSTRPVGEAIARLRLGDVLVAAGEVSEADLARALQLQASEPQPRRRLGTVLVSLGLVDDRQIAAALARVHNLPVIGLDATRLDRAAAQLIPRGAAERHKVLVLGWNGRLLRVAVADPVDVVALDDVRTLAGAAGLDVSVAPESQIAAALETVWSEAVDQAVYDEFLKEVTPEAVEAETGNENDAAAIKMVDRVLAHGARLNASDIHVEPQRDGVRVRMRVDGILREVLHLPQAAYSSMVARLKIISGLNVIERRVPQDGRTRISIEGRALDVRVSTLPSLRGEKVVLRLLPDSRSLPTLDGLGMAEDQSRVLRDVLHLPQGLVLITGPTGSGKTNTLYAGISEVVDAERNVITLEDPVEVELPGSTQVQIDEKVGMTFARGLRAVLRQDPDIVLVGEIRDQETAELAIRAALTGHLVLSTLHTLDSPAALTRLTDMGVAPYLVASSLSLVLAQRLLRRPCPDCVVHEPMPADVATRLGLTGEYATHAYPRAVGCAHCGDTGYAGRIGVFETLVVTPAVRDALLSGAGETEVRRAALATGWLPLAQRAVLAAAAGRTTIAEVLRVVATTLAD
ncbi:MAG: type II/IV secretion system protein [Actinomycetota bacterium]|nr:MAG: type II/IV secretion system protein [Actinomycetota bacterium]